SNLYRLIFSARAVRGIGDGYGAIVLPAYLQQLGFDAFRIGIITAAALLGSAVVTLLIGFLAPRYRLRSLLLICAVLMIATGIGVAAVHYFAFILVVVFIGTLN